MMKKLSLLAVLLCMALTLTACAEAPVMKVASPSGAPGLALATLAVQNPENYNFVAAETIAAEFAQVAEDDTFASTEDSVVREASEDGDDLPWTEDEAE